MYLASATYAYNTSISKTTGDTPFFLIYGRESVKVPDVALLPPLIRSNSVDYHQERLIRQICTARQLATECTQQAQQCMKLYYDQHAKDQTFWVGHKVWICNYAVKLGLSKKLCCLWHGPFCLIEKITPVSFKVANLQGKLQKDSIYVNRMKQYFTYDEPPTDSSPHNNSNEPSRSLTPCPQALVTEPASTEHTQLADIILSRDSRNTTPDAVESLQELNLLPDLINSNQKKLNGFHVINEGYQLILLLYPTV